MFQLCNELEYLDLSNFNTSSVTNMGWMFNECYKLKATKGLNNFNMKKVINIKAMFQKCEELEYLEMPRCYIENVTDMEGTFAGCFKLKEIKVLNNFYTSKVTNMRIMFQLCNELEYLDLSNFNTSNVINMEGMFAGCFKLKEIKGLNNFNTSKLATMKIMFQE